MLRDRGLKKWIGLMLPEHVVLLKEWKKVDSYVQYKEKTEWELEDIQQTIQQAIEMKLLVTLTLWDNHTLHDETGLITGSDSINRELLLETERAVKRIAFDKIQNAKIAEFTKDQDSFY